MQDKIDYNLRPLWQAILDIYKEVARICKKYSLRHQSAFGTVLGAVRHGGFIPWDDDFDVMMPRDDYERFLEVAQTELPDYLKTYLGGSEVKQPDGATKNVWLHWCTLREEREDVVREVETHSNLKISQGIYIDIFPIDGMPSYDLSFFFWRIWRSFLLAGGYSYAKDVPAFMSGLWIRKHIIGQLARLFFPCCRSSEDFFWKVEAFGKQIPYNSSKFAGFAYSAIKGEMRQPRSLFEDTVLMKFEDISIPIPKDYDHYLQLTFGDWRKLPPEDKRKPGHQTLN